MVRQIGGLLLLLLGLGIIIFTLVESYNIFMGRDDVPQLFRPEEFSGTSPSDETEEGGLEGELKDIIREQTQSQINKIMPSSIIAKTLNLLAWTLFAGIAVFSGARIGGLGIKLLKKE